MPLVAEDDDDDDGGGGGSNDDGCDDEITYKSQSKDAEVMTSYHVTCLSNLVWTILQSHDIKSHKVGE